VHASMKLCKENVLRTIPSLRLCTEPSLDACQAIILCASIAMEDAKSAIAWRLTSMASRMALDLGLHRLRKDGTTENHRKRLAFWSVYVMDKGLAFNLGRSPTIQDYDILTDRPTHPEDLKGPWGLLYQATIDFAVLQGEIYEQLFSIRAQRESEVVRTHRARNFAAKVQELRKPVMEVSRLRYQGHIVPRTNSL
jgi:hypothetical protein